MSIHVAIVDDHIAVRLGMRYLVHEWMPESTVHLAKNLSELLHVLSQERMDIVVLDINIPGGNNFRMIPMIRDVQADVRILMLSAYDEGIYALRYIDSGADGYLQKDCEDDAIQEALNTLLAGKKYLSGELKEELLQNRLSNPNRSYGNPMGQLTNRELEVCQLLLNGMGVNEIAESLSIHISTASTFKHKIFEKLNVKNLKELMDVFNITGFSVK